MEKLLAGKAALITGGNRGIGRAITEKFIAEGARVALHYHNHPAEAESLKAEHDAGISLFRADLSDAEETSRLFEKVISSLGSIGFR